MKCPMCNVKREGRNCSYCGYDVTFIQKCMKEDGVSQLSDYVTRGINSRFASITDLLVKKLKTFYLQYGTVFNPPAQEIIKNDLERFNNLYRL